jgi:hypothetical protein
VDSQPASVQGGKAATDAVFSESVLLFISAKTRVSKGKLLQKQQPVCLCFDAIHHVCIGRQLRSVLFDVFPVRDVVSSGEQLLNSTFIG